MKISKVGRELPDYIYGNTSPYIEPFETEPVGRLNWQRVQKLYKLGRKCYENK